MNTPNDAADKIDATELMDAATPAADTAAEPSVGEQQPLDVVGGDPAPTEPAAGEATDDEDFESMLALRNLEKSRAEKKRKKRITIIAIAAIAAGILAVILGQHFLGTGETEEEIVPETATVMRQDFENVISTSGALKAGTTVVVTPEVDGIIESVLVTEGQKVKKDDLLFTIKNDTLDKAVRDAQQDLQSANEGVAKAQREVGEAVAARDEAWDRYNEAWADADDKHDEWEYARDNYESDHADWEARKAAAEELKTSSVEPVAPVEPACPEDEEHKSEWETYYKLYKEYQDNKTNWDAYQNALAQIDADYPGGEPQPAGVEPTYPEAPEDTALVSAIQSAEDGVTSANREVVKAQEAYDEAVQNAEKRKVVAPASGNIVSLGAKVGESVGGGSSSGSSSDKGSSSTPLVQISDVNQMSVDVEVNEIDILNIKKGQNAKTTFSAVQGVECDAIVSEVATVATGGGGGGEGGGVVTFHVGLTIPRPDEKLREGMTANVKIYTASVKDALVVPTAAVTEMGDSYTVEVVVDEETFETETRQVSVGERNSNLTVITEGLEEGETVLLGGGVPMDTDEEL